MIVPIWAAGRVIGIGAVKVSEVLTSELTEAEPLDSLEELLEPPQDVATREITPTQANARMMDGFFMMWISPVFSKFVSELFI